MEFLLERIRMIINKIPQDMNIPMKITGGKFDAGYDFQFGIFRAADSFVYAVSGVMIGQCKSSQSGGRCQGYQFGRDKRTVRVIYAAA